MIIYKELGPDQSWQEHALPYKGEVIAGNDTMGAIRLVEWPMRVELAYGLVGLGHTHWRWLNT
jgi:hypothetical protein